MTFSLGTKRTYEKFGHLAAHWLHESDSDYKIFQNKCALLLATHE